MRRNVSNHWTEHETEALMRNYPQHMCHVERWDERIDRDAASVRAKARQLGLTAMYPDPRYNAPWTDREVAALRRNYPEHGAKVGDWDEPIERNRKAITGKARKMGMYKRRGGMSIDERAAEKLAQAWRMIARNLGASKYALVDDLVMLRERGDL